MKKKIIIQVWTHNVSNYKQDNYNHFWGLGDILRGTIQLFQLSQSMDFKLIVDIQHHPISQFIEKQSHEYESLIMDNKDNIPFIFGGENVKNYILENNKDVIFFLTNDIYNEPINESCKIFIKNLLTINDTFYSFFQKKKKEILFDDYNILHFRLGDDEIIRNIYNNNYEKEKNIFIRIKEEKDILVSDSIQFKNFIKNQSDIFMFHMNIGHFGYHTDIEILRNTIFEFFLIIYSKKIKSYSIYPWISGFIKIAKEIYDIETEII